MKFVLPSSEFGLAVRLLAAAALVALLAVGAPMHSHDFGAGTDDGSATQKAPCAACVTHASPGLVLDRTDFVPRLRAVDVVVSDATSVVTLPLPARSGRAPPAA